MSRRNRQDNQRDWRRPQQNRPGENQWSGGRREDEYGETRQGQGRPDWDRGGGDNRWGNEQDWGRQRPQQGRGEWEGDRGMEGGYTGDTGRRSRQPWENWDDQYQGLGGRGWREGWDDAMHRGEGQFTGRGPRNYKRADNRIEEDVNERLTRHSMIDATEVEVTVQNGEVTLRGYVMGRDAKRMAEDIADSVFGVKDVINQIKVRQRGEQEDSRQETETSTKQRKAS